MPTPAERLRKDSSAEAIREAISASIRQLMHEGRDQKQAAAIAYSQARKSTGKSLGGKG